MLLLNLNLMKKLHCSFIGSFNTI